MDNTEVRTSSVAMKGVILPLIHPILQDETQELRYRFLINRGDSTGKRSDFQRGKIFRSSLISCSTHNILEFSLGLEY